MGIRVESLSRLTKTKTRVTLENDRTLVLSSREIRQYHIKEGEEVPDDTLQEMNEELRSAALRKCGSLLQGMDYTQKGLAEKLQRAGFPSDIIEDTARKMVEAKYVDDRRFAENYVHYHLQNYGLVRIRMDLKKKGVSDELIREVLSDQEEEHTEIEEEQIIRLIQKKGYDFENEDYAAKQKLFAYLMRRGYTYERICAAIDKIAQDD